MRGTPVTVVGTLVGDTRLRRVGPDGKLVLNFRIASNERRYDKASGSWVDGDSLYLSVSCWRTLAENAATLVKGDPVIVSGRLRTREWTTEEGVRRSVVEMEASAVGPDLARCTAAVRKLRRVEETMSTEDQTAEALDEFNLPDEASLPDEFDLPVGDRLPDEVSLSDLAEAVGPLVPVPA
ncbi:MAG: single-stranded DNA-binding protein [Pseudonocardiaceae bacterium]